ncbi:hypothetical protein CS063_12455 [Sporanaerobium hydrogeniformans]|uniref:Uncharacterized protein n=1 Tax=Sporanaerobium hydrogeniformans TaxID=3072179 RepID=A0AC61DA42_9FIRM|nr:peptidyl-prolyl cis-trans isomerase [Sporanaerobium hydrogeniformans]PHV70109.1 hypothetical protein CS063_12455 [Sporanaerobium hydrogeniformans]
MKIFKKIVAIGLLTLLTLSTVACNGKENVSSTPSTTTPTTTIAKVGKVEIPRERYDEQLAYLDSMMQWQFGADYSSNQEALAYYEQQKQEIVDFLVDAELLLQKAEALKLEVSEEDINAELESTKAGFDSEEAFNDALKSKNLTLEALKENIKKDLLISKMVEQQTADVTVTDDEIQAYYNENKGSFTTSPGAQMAHVLLETEEAAKEAKAAYDNGSSTFEELAAKHNTDSTKDTGGALGFVAYDAPNYDPDFLAGAKKLKEGEVSEPVKSAFGWHLIKVTDIQSEAVTQPLEEVKASIQNSLESQKAADKLDAYLESLRTEIPVEIYKEALK